MSNKNQPSKPAARRRSSDRRWSASFSVHYFDTDGHPLEDVGPTAVKGVVRWRLDGKNRKRSFTGPNFVGQIREFQALLVAAYEGNWPAGGFSVGFFQGWPHGVEASVARLGEAATRTEVNGQQAVTFSNQVNSWVMWTVDGRSTAAVESSDLDMATLIEVAESVASVPLAEWRTLAGVEPADAPASTDDGAGFRALGDNGVVHLTITQLRDVSEIWSTRVGPELTDPDLWGRRAADVCMLGVWNPGMAELIASEYISQDLGSADEQVHSGAADAVWEIAANVCPDAFPEGALETGPPSGARP